jgi:hypothetical protein
MTWATVSGGKSPDWKGKTPHHMDLCVLAKFAKNLPLHQETERHWRRPF